MRYTGYFRHLRELLQNGVLKVSSGELGKRAGVPSSLVRTDLSRFENGQSGYGYNVKKLYREISIEMGLSEGMNAVIIGEGGLADSIARCVEGRGILLKGIFTEQEFDFSVSADIAVICNLNRDIQPYAEKLKENGFKGIWNLTQKNIILEIPIINMPLGDIIMELTREIKNNEVCN